MGGSGSTRWNWHTKKDTVEESLKLDIHTALRMGSTLGFVAWMSGGKTAGSIGVHWDRSAEQVALLFNANGQKADQRVRLTATYPFHGKPRWWFSCPLCRRRCGCLYLPPGTRCFACRHCHDLTYAARQERSGYIERNFPELALLEEIEKVERQLRKYKYWCAGARHLLKRLERLEERAMIATSAREEAASTHF